MPALRRLLRLPLLVAMLALGVVSARAHQVPGMQIEAEFFLNTDYTLTINLDPRLFLSDQPASLPMVAASWYSEQTPEQIKATEKAAMDYLRKNVRLQFGVDEVPMPDCTFVAMDGGTGKPITPATEEVHLQATARSKVAVNGRNFSINLGREAGVSLVLLNTMEGQSDRKPRVIFPGEGSEPFPLTGMVMPVIKKAAPEALAPPKSEFRLWLYRGGLAVVLFVFYNFFLKKRRLPVQDRRRYDR